MIFGGSYGAKIRIATTIRDWPMNGEEITQRDPGIFLIEQLGRKAPGTRRPGWETIKSFAADWAVW